MTTTATEPTSTRPLPTLAGAIHSNCNCTRCRIGYNNWLTNRRASIAAGTWAPFVDATPARKHIESLYAAGMSLPVMAILAKLHLEDIRRVRGPVGTRPRAERIRPDTAKAILAVELHFSRLPGNALIPTRGAVRRVQALRALGWPSKNIGTRAGLSQKGMCALMVQKQTTVTTHLAIARVFEDLHNQDPVLYGVDLVIARRTRRYASTHHWAVPGAWADIDTDKKPNRFVRAWNFEKTAAGARGESVVEETEYLASFGFNKAEVCERIGIGWDSIKAAHRRAGVEVPLRLAQERAVDP